MKRFPLFLRIWLLSFLVCASAVAFSFARMDVPIALLFSKVGAFPRVLNSGFGTAVILSLESAVALGLILTRLVRGHISPFGEALAIACLASICAHGVNSGVLKPFFGVPVPAEVMKGVTHAFNFFGGTANSSFPSGHMMLAGAFAGVFMRLQRASVWPLCALLLLAGSLLIVEDYHFLSDVIAGGFLSVSAGFLAGEVWAVHSKLLP